MITLALFAIAGLSRNPEFRSQDRTGHARGWDITRQGWSRERARGFDTQVGRTVQPFLESEQAANPVLFVNLMFLLLYSCAGMAELVDAADSKSFPRLCR